MKPLVSVVVATYKRDEALHKALLSLGEQTYPSTEIVLVDDNGEAEWNKKVKSIVEKFKEKHPNIPLVYVANQVNQGSAKTRNNGIKAASGEYITFLDDDDIYLPLKVEKQVSFMIEKGLDYSITDLELFNESDKLVDKRKRGYIRKFSSEHLLEMHLRYHLTGTDTFMFRKEYIDKIGGFPLIDVGDEFYLMQRAIENGGKFGYLPVCDVKAYVHTGEGGLSSGQGKIDGENALYNHKKQYFDRISKKSAKYIRARHFAVIAYAYLRMRSWGRFLKNMFLGFISSPYIFCRIMIER